jgi:hypothetical protein
MQADKRQNPWPSGLLKKCSSPATGFPASDLAIRICGLDNISSPFRCATCSLYGTPFRDHVEYLGHLLPLFPGQSPDFAAFLRNMTAMIDDFFLLSCDVCVKLANPYEMSG